MTSLRNTISGRTLLRLSAALTAAALSISCRQLVLEDRTPCPCFLYVHLDATESIPSVISHGNLVAVCNPDGFRTSVHPLRHQDAPSGYLFEVPKSTVAVSVYGGLSTMKRTDEAITIADGAQCDSLYSARSSVLCMDERVDHWPHPTKDFSTVRIKIVNIKAVGDATLELCSQWNGYTLPSLNLSQGTFTTTMEKLSADEFSLRIPRQGDDSLILNIYNTDSRGQVQKYLLGFPLGREIAWTGFDWMQPSLPDIYIELQASMTDVDVTVKEWIDGGSSDVEF